MKATKALYVSKSKSTHDERFVEVFREFIQLDEVYLNDSGLPISRDDLIERDLIIASPLSTGISGIPNESLAQIIGICMAYEINEESKDLSVAVEIYQNIQRCFAIICDCQQIEQEIRERFNFNGPILRIAYGCNQKDLLDIEFQNQEILRIVSTRNWTRIHSNETSLQALNTAKEYGLKFEIKYFGEGKELTEDVKLKNTENFQEAVSFRGPYSQSDLPKILANSEVYISTSISDGTSVSLLEAMSAGRICLVRDFASNREWIKHGENGFLFSTSEELSDLLISISRLSFEEKLSISKAARCSVIGRGDWKESKKALIAFGQKWI